VRKQLSAFLLTAIFLIWAVANISAQTTTPSNITKVQLSQAEIDRIVKTFSEKEVEFRRSLNNYGFRREVVIQELGFGGQIKGEYIRNSNFTFDDNGKRYEKIVFFPMPTFGGVTAEDLEDLGGVNPFALEPGKIALYNFTFVGKEKIDELNLYVFDVAPKVTPDPKKSIDRYFIGRIWVDDQDLLIVKTKGKGIPETKNNKFAVVETWRENIDGKYWFPTYSYANDELIFENGSTLKIKMKVRYFDFKEASSTVKVLDDGEVVDDKPKTEIKPTPTPSPTPKKP
jgi:hypothetical protein